MSRHRIAHTDIRMFAELCGRYDHPFSDHASVLSEAGLTVSEWEAMRSAWRERIVSDTAPARLAKTFGEAYSCAVSSTLTLSAQQSTPKDLLSPATRHSPTIVSVSTGGAIGPRDEHLMREPARAMDATTGPVDISAIAKKAVPFDPTKAPSLPQARPVAAAPSAEEMWPPPAETGEVDVSALGRKVLVFGPAAHPSPAPPRGQAGDWTVERYALLSAELVLATDARARSEVLLRFGIDDTGAFTTMWRKRFEADAALAERFHAAYAEHYARLCQGRSSGPGPR